MTLSIDEIVQRRIREWDERRRRQAEEGSATAGEQRPVITVSRAFGAKGAALARQAARLLGLPLYDREIVEHIAREASVRAQVVAAMDAKVREIIDAQVGDAMDAGTFTYSDYMRHLSRLVLGIARTESAVIVGRGAQFILDPRRTLRVRVTAPLAVRIRRVAADRGIPEKEARAEVMRADAERAAFVRWHFNKDVTAADHYDMVLNSDALGIDLGADLVVTAFTRRFTGGAAGETTSPQPQEQP